MEIGDRNGRPVSTIRQLAVIVFDEEIHFRLISVIVDTLQSIRQPTGRLAPALVRLATSSLEKNLSDVETSRGSRAGEKVGSDTDIAE